MSAVFGKSRLSREEFLEWERTQTEKHEFVAGEVFAMAGASRKHNLVAGNVFRHLAAAISGSPCRAFISDIKLEVAFGERFYYPDVMVTCDPRDLAAEQIMVAPSLIIGVLSASTAAYDRGEKFAAYRTITELQEYVLIDPETGRVDGFRRESPERWIVVDYAPDGPVLFTSLQVELGRSQIFDGVE